MKGKDILKKKAYVVIIGGPNITRPDEHFWVKAAELPQKGKESIRHTKLLIDELVKAGIIKFSSHPFKSSPFAIAQQTTKMLAHGKPFQVVNDLGPAVGAWDLLKENFPDAAASDITDLFKNEAASLLYAEGEKLFNCVIESISLINPGESTVFVTHSRLIEAAMAIASGEWEHSNPEVREGDIIVFSFDNKNCLIADNRLAAFGHLRCSP